MKKGFTGERIIILPPMIKEAAQHDPLVSSLYITDIGYYPHADHHYCERKEPINEYVLIYCVEGKGWYTVNNEQYEVSANQYFILPPHHPHAYGADKSHPWSIYWIHFTGKHAAVYSEGQERPQSIQPSMNSRISERQHVFEEIFNTLQLNTDEESLRYASSLLHYYLASMRYLRHYRQSKIHDDTDLIEAAKHYMEENIERHVSLDQLAHYTGYSPSHFSMLFRQRTGEPPLAYMNRMKIEYACQLLQTTNMRINQVCHKIGIDDSYYFSRLFKRLKGVSPQHYRLSMTP